MKFEGRIGLILNRSKLKLTSVEGKNVNFSLWKECDAKEKRITTIGDKNYAFNIYKIQILITVVLIWANSPKK